MRDFNQVNLVYMSHLNFSRNLPYTYVDLVEGVCNGFLPYTRFLGFLEFSGYHQWQQESQ